MEAACTACEFGWGDPPSSNNNFKCISVCGDNKLAYAPPGAPLWQTQGSETCDPGKGSSNGCSPLCKIQPGYYWSWNDGLAKKGKYGFATPICGDGLVVAGEEECDPGVLPGKISYNLEWKHTTADKKVSEVVWYQERTEVTTKIELRGCTNDCRLENGWALGSNKKTPEVPGPACHPCGG